MPTKVTYRHFHDGNDQSRFVRGTSIYATRARLVCLNTGEVLTEAWAYCNPHDSPCRLLGRQYARERVIDKAKHILQSIEPIKLFVEKEAHTSKVAELLDNTDRSSIANLI